MKFLLLATIVAVLALSVFFVLYGKDQERPTNKYDAITVARIASKVNHQRQIAFATLLEETVDSYKFITVAHALEKTEINSVILLLDGGERISIDDVIYPRHEDDLAIIYVKKNSASSLRLGAVPTVAMIDKFDLGKTVFLYNEQVYGEGGKYSVKEISESSPVRLFTLNGKIDHGRSGSPVMREADGSLLGIVQGNNMGRETGFNGIQCISVYNLPRNGNN